MAPSHETMTILYNHIPPQTQLQSNCNTLRIFEEYIYPSISPTLPPTPPKPADLCHHNWKTEHPMSVIAPPPEVDIQVAISSSFTKAMRFEWSLWLLQFHSLLLLPLFYPKWWNTHAEKAGMQRSKSPQTVRLVQATHNGHGAGNANAKGLKQQWNGHRHLKPASCSSEAPYRGCRFGPKICLGST